MVVVAVVSYGYALAWAASFAATSMATSTAAVATATGVTAATIATTAGAIVGGAVAGAASGLIMTGSLSGALKGALVGAVGGALFGGISSQFGDTWSIGRLAASGVAGGITSEVGGGSFRNGFLMGAAIAGVQWGYQGLRAYTNKAKFLANKYDPENQKLIFNNKHEVNTYGTRGNAPGVVTKKSYISRILHIMGEEGNSLENNWFGDGFNDGIGRFLNNVSKVHDPLNMWYYNALGFIKPFTTQIGAELFEIYSMSGMVPAAMYTAVNQFGTEFMVVHPNITHSSIHRNHR